MDEVTLSLLKSEMETQIRAIDEIYGRIEARKMRFKKN